MIDIVVIGAGQAGLAAAAALNTSGLSTLVVDAEVRTGDVWRRRYSSLTLFTPRWMSALPGVPLPGDPEGYATGAEFAGYLEGFAERMGINVQHATRVVALSQNADRGFVAHFADGRSVAAKAVVVANGAFQYPIVPEGSASLAAGVRQLTVTTYRSPEDVPSGTALVVGDGASGRDIAVDLAATHKVVLAAGRPRRLLPERVLGISTWRWLHLLGLLSARPDSPPGRLMRKADPFPNRQRHLDDLRNQGIEILPRFVRAAGRSVHFQDGSHRQIDAVIWALGYGDDFGWIDIPAAFRDGRIVHDQGRSPVDGLWYMGRPWQRNRASGLIAGVGPDAAVVAAQARAWLKT